MEVPAPFRTPPACVLCGEPAAPGSPSKGKAALTICHNADCRTIADQQSKMVPALFQQYLSMQVKMLPARRAEQKERARLLREKSEADAAEEAAWWSRLETLEIVRSLPEAVRLQIPTGTRPTAATGQDRRLAYEAYLRAIIAEAAEAPALGPASDAAQDPAAVPDPLAPMLCAKCGGGCCTGGGDRAYLTANTMRRVMTADPEASAEALLGRYLALVPDEGMADSCINHTPQGCQLPRELRSDTCNMYRCLALETLLARPVGADGSRAAVLVVQRREDQWRQRTPGVDNAITSAAAITEAGVVPLEPRPALEAVAETSPSGREPP